MKEHEAFTIKYNRRTNRLTTSVTLLPHEQKEGYSSEPKVLNCAWDTGATQTSIDLKVAENMGLISQGSTIVNTANSTAHVNTYIVDIILPNRVMVHDVVVLCCDISDTDVLIGMDIIALGDFSVTNADDCTTFSFRIPSMGTIDYVELHNTNLVKFKESKIE